MRSLLATITIIPAIFPIVSSFNSPILIHKNNEVVFTRPPPQNLPINTGPLHSIAPPSSLTSLSSKVSNSRTILTPTGRRGKGKTIFGVRYDPPTPTDATQVILLTADLPNCSKDLRERGKCKYIIVPGEVVLRETGWEVDFASFIKEQTESAPPGSVPAATAIFLDAMENPKLFEEKIPDLSKAGLTGVVVSDPSQIPLATSLDLAVLYKLPDFDHSKGLDISSDLDSLPSTDSVAGVILPPHEESFFEGAEDELDNIKLYPKPPEPYTSLPVLVETDVPAGDGKLQVATRKLASLGYSSVVMLPSCAPPGLPPKLTDLTNFWIAALSTLNSARSTKFGGFRSKVSLEKDVPLEWQNYQKDVMSSGALGKVGASSTDDADAINTATGDYKGF